MDEAEICVREVWWMEGCVEEVENDDVDDDDDDDDSDGEEV